MRLVGLYTYCKMMHGAYKVKKVLSTYSERVSEALDIQDAKRMRRIIFSFVVSLAVLYSTASSRKRNDFCKTIIEHNMCVLSFSAVFLLSISRSEKN